MKKKQILPPPVRYKSVTSKTIINSFLLHRRGLFMQVTKSYSYLSNHKLSLMMTESPNFDQVSEQKALVGMGKVEW